MKPGEFLANEILLAIVVICGLTLVMMLAVALPMAIDDIAKWRRRRRT